MIPVEAQQPRTPSRCRNFENHPQGEFVYIAAARDAETNLRTRTVMQEPKYGENPNIRSHNLGYGHGHFYTPKFLHQIAEPRKSK